jgi:hypothetical protein
MTHNNIKSNHYNKAELHASLFAIKHIHINKKQVGKNERK